MTSTDDDSSCACANGDECYKIVIFDANRVPESMKKRWKNKKDLRERWFVGVCHLFRTLVEEILKFECDDIEVNLPWKENDPVVVDDCGGNDEDSLVYVYTDDKDCCYEYIDLTTPDASLHQDCVGTHCSNNAKDLETVIVDLTKCNLDDTIDLTVDSPKITKERTNVVDKEWYSDRREVGPGEESHAHAGETGVQGSVSLNVTGGIEVQDDLLSTEHDEVDVVTESTGGSPAKSVDTFDYTYTVKDSEYLLEERECKSEYHMSAKISPAADVGDTVIDLTQCSLNDPETLTAESSRDTNIHDRPGTDCASGESRNEPEYAVEVSDISSQVNGNIDSGCTASGAVDGSSLVDDDHDCDETGGASPSQQNTTTEHGTNKGTDVGDMVHAYTENNEHGHVVKCWFISRDEIIIAGESGGTSLATEQNKILGHVDERTDGESVTLDENAETRQDGNENDYSALFPEGTGELEHERLAGQEDEAASEVNRTTSLCDVTASVGDITASVGDGSASVGDGSASVGDITASVGDKTPSVGDRTTSMGDVTASVGDRSASVGDMTASLGDRTASVGDRTPPMGDITASVGDMTASVGDKTPSVVDRTPSVGDRAASVGDITASVGDMTASVGDRSVSGDDTTASVGDRTPFVVDRTPSVGDITASVGDRTASVGDKTVSVGERTPVADISSESDCAVSPNSIPSDSCKHNRDANNNVSNRSDEASDGEEEVSTMLLSLECTSMFELWKGRCNPRDNIRKCHPTLQEDSVALEMEVTRAMLTQKYPAATPTMAFTAQCYADGDVMVIDIVPHSKADEFKDCYQYMMETLSKLIYGPNEEYLFHGHRVLLKSNPHCNQ